LFILKAAYQNKHINYELKQKSENCSVGDNNM